MALTLLKLFKRDTQQPVSQPANGIAQPNSDNKRQEETYSNWGKRICATSFGSDLVLSPFLLNVYNYIKREQAQDAQYQQQARAEHEAQITQNNNNIEASGKRIENYKEQKEENDKQKLNLENQATEIKASTFKVNKEAKAKFILGGIILLLLTIYLFLFYGSTCYSAIFSGGTSYANASDAMFNANAFGEAANKSILTLILLLVFPVTFLGLGFLLHYFSISKDKSKYFKIATILFITFIFDCLLAFLIGRNIHNTLVNNALIPESPYTLGTAIADAGFWIVIFCGFIAYIIWGLVFDQTMDALSKKDQNKIELQAIDDKIDALDKANIDLNNKTDAEDAKILKLKNENAQINVSLAGTVFYNEGKIKTEMTNFFSGWMAQLAFLGKSTAEQESAQSVFNQCLLDLKL